jgi:predicted transcriptional regulator
MKKKYNIKQMNNTLATILINGKISITQLSKQKGISTQATHKQITKLYHLGFVQNSQKKGITSSRYIELTEKGMYFLSRSIYIIKMKEKLESEELNLFNKLEKNEK